MTLWALAGWHWSVPVLIGAATALCALLRRLLPMSPVAVLRRSPPTVADHAARSILLVSIAAAFVATASGSASSADLIFFWGPKAQAFAAARTIDAGFLGDPFLAYLHVSYPPLLPNIEALASMVGGRFAWGAATLLFPLLLALLAATLPSLLRLAAPPRMAVAAAALAVSASGYLGDSFDIAGNGDMPLLFFEAVAAALLVGSWAFEKGGQLFAGLMLAGAVSTKVEGVAFALGIGALFLVVRRKEIRWPPAALRLLVPPAACLGAWFAFGASRRIFFGYRGYLKTFQTHWERLPVVIAAIGEALFSAGWALPFLLPLAILFAAKGGWRLPLIPAGTALILAAFFVFTYLHDDPNLRLWIRWSGGRIFLPFAALFVIAAAARAEETAA